MYKITSAGLVSLHLWVIIVDSICPWPIDGKLRV